MDASIAAAGRALTAGDPLSALKRVALRGDPPALALRGIAMAQLGDLPRARELLRRAARGFGPRDALARARCVTAEAEVALAARDLAWPARVLPEALRVFLRRGEVENALHARLLQIRRLLLLGRVEEADGALAGLALEGAPARLAAVAALLGFERALRRGRVDLAHAALARARAAAARAGIGALGAEVARAGRALALPAARLVEGGAGRPLTLGEVGAVLASADLVVDGCGRAARQGSQVVRLARRPVLFALLRLLAEAWPGDAPRDHLIARAFEARRIDASHRARLRVELGRLRRALGPLADVRATARGFALAPRVGAVRLLAPPVESPNAAVLALLADGEAWSTSGLALALGGSQRSVQRALAALEAAGQVRGLGRGRSRRWLSAPIAGFATPLLLPGADVLD